MSNVVFILGAGASAASGAPVMRNFLDVARDLLATGRVEGHRCHFETVFRIIGSLQQVHSKAQLDLTNIESIFTVLELARIIKRIPGVAGESEIDAAISALKVLIVKTLEMSITYPFREHSRQPLPPEIAAHRAGQLGRDQARGANRGNRLFRELRRLAGRP